MKRNESSSEVRTIMSSIRRKDESSADNLTWHFVAIEILDAGVSSFKNAKRRHTANLSELER